MILAAVRSDRVGLDDCERRRGLLVPRGSDSNSWCGDDRRVGEETDESVSILTVRLYSDISCNFRLRDCGVRDSGGGILLQGRESGRERFFNDDKVEILLIYGRSSFIFLFLCFFFFCDFFAIFVVFKLKLLQSSLKCSKA